MIKSDHRVFLRNVLSHRRVGDEGCLSWVSGGGNLLCSGEPPPISETRDVALSEACVYDRINHLLKGLLYNFHQLWCKTQQEDLQKASICVAHRPFKIKFSIKTEKLQNEPNPNQTPGRSRRRLKPESAFRSSLLRGGGGG